MELFCFLLFFFSFFNYPSKIFILHVKSYILYNNFFYGTLFFFLQEFILRARRYRKSLGGGMRQAGILAACGLLSLDVMYERLAEDHDRLNHMTTKILTSNECKPWLSHKATEEKTMTTNLGFYQVKNGRAGELVELLRSEHNILVSAKNNDMIRACTHHHVTDEDVEIVVHAMENIVKQWS